MSNHSKLVVILGPTASGKTELALKLAKKFDGEIAGADSRQIYRGMDIGTGKPCAKKQKNKKTKKQNFVLCDGIKHYMVDVVDPDSKFSVAEYKEMAIKIIRDILKRGKVPFLVGGTGLYIQAVVDNLEIPHVPPNKKLRAQFEKEFKKAVESESQKVMESKVLEKWYKKLLKLDPGAMRVVDPKNSRRIIRAIEVCLATHQPFSKLRRKGEPMFDILQIGIAMPRKGLYERYDRRVDKMIREGLAEETKWLFKKYDPESPSMSGIGYKEIGEYLQENKKIRKQENKKLLDASVQEIKWRTHAYARRQMTWFRKDGRIVWVKNGKEAEKEIVKWLNC